MILHNNPTALIEQGNTLADPKFKDGGTLKTFDYVVANPPFCDKRWSTGIDPANDEFERFKHFGMPPAKQGDYAYLLHIVRSLKSTGKGACILPHGVLFRGNAEADIRRALVRKGYIKGIIGLPAKPLLRHRHPGLHHRRRQAGRSRPQGHLHDRRQRGLHEGRPQEPPTCAGHSQDRRCLQPAGSKSRNTPEWYRSRKSRRTTSISTCRATSTASRPRIFRTSRATCVAAFPNATWMLSAATGKSVRIFAQVLFKANRPGYVDLAVEKAAIKSTIYGHPEFAAFISRHERPLRRLAAERAPGRCGS